MSTYLHENDSLENRASIAILSLNYSAFWAIRLVNLDEGQAWLANVPSFHAHGNASHFHVVDRTHASIVKNLRKNELRILSM